MNSSLVAPIVASMALAYDPNFHTFARILVGIGWIFGLVLGTKALLTGRITAAAGPLPRWMAWYMIIVSTVITVVAQFWLIPMM